MTSVPGRSVVESTLVSSGGGVESGAHPIAPGVTRGERGPSRHRTPLRPARPNALASPAASRATLTIMSGPDAGRMIALDDEVTVIGRDAGRGAPIEDSSVSRRHACIARGSDGCFTIEDLGSTNGTLVQGVRVARARLEPGSYVQLGASFLLRFALVDATDEEMRRRLYETSIHDPLTRVYNRRYFYGRLDAEVASARRTGDPLALIMVDVDEFKRFNDRFGHLPGDRALCFIAAQVARLVGSDSVLARYGGEEFVALAPGSTHADAMRVAERIRRGIDAIAFSVAGNSVNLSVSIGVASLSEVSELAEFATGGQGAALVGLADERLYAAKRAGRNVVCGGG